MRKLSTVFMVALVLILVLQPYAFAAGEKVYSAKPTEGVEASNPNLGSSSEGLNFAIQSSEGLIYYWSAFIYNHGTFLEVYADTETFFASDVVSVTAYLQRWNGYSWEDVQSWSSTEYNTDFTYVAEFPGFSSGNYYRTRAVHYAREGTETETQESTSSYIYVP